MARFLSHAPGDGLVVGLVEYNIGDSAADALDKFVEQPSDRKSSWFVSSSGFPWFQCVGEDYRLTMEGLPVQRAASGRYSLTYARAWHAPRMARTRQRVLDV
jgi:hypothetical protein